MKAKRCPADVAFSIALRMSRNNRCEYCGRTDRKQDLAHIYGRRAKSIRWDTMNALCLCAFPCHSGFTENPLDFEEWLTDYLGQGYIDILKEKRNRLSVGIAKVTKAERQAIAKHYREQIKLMEAGPHDLVSYQ